MPLEELKGPEEEKGGRVERWRGRESVTSSSSMGEAADGVD